MAEKECEVQNNSDSISCTCLLVRDLHKKKHFTETDIAEWGKIAIFGGRFEKNDES